MAAGYELPGGAVRRHLHTKRARLLLLAALIGLLCAAFALVSSVGGGGRTVRTCGSVASLTLAASPARVTDGGDLVISWTHSPERLARCSEDFVTLSCGPTSGDDDFFQRRNVSDADATPTSVRFSGTNVYSRLSLLLYGSELLVLTGTERQQTCT